MKIDKTLEGKIIFAIGTGNNARGRLMTITDQLKQEKTNEN